MTKHASFQTEPSNERVPAWKRAVAVGTLSASALFAVGCTPQGDSTPAPTETSSSSSTPTPGETTPADPETITVESLKIPTGLSDQELATAYIELRNDWWTAGATDELRMDRLEANQPWDQFLPSVVAENTQLYAPAVYGAEWQTNPDVAEVLGNNIAGNLNYLTNFVATAWSDDPANIEPFSSEMKLENVATIEDTDTSRTLEMTYSLSNNSEKNIVDDTPSSTGTILVTFTESNGSEVATSSSTK